MIRSRSFNRFNIFAGLGASGVILWVCFWIAVLVGWVINIVDLVGMIGGNQLTTLFVARIVGIFFFPLGAILGWFW